MGGFLNINTLVNGRALTPSRMTDPFNLRAFPGAVDQMRGKTLDRLGRDICSAAQMLAANDPDIERLNISYTIEGGDLVINSEQEHATGHQYLREKALETGDDTYYRSAPKNHLLKASLGVLHGKSQGYNTIDLFAADVVKQWRSARGISGTTAKGRTPFANFGTIAGFLSVGSAYMSGIPL